MLTKITLENFKVFRHATEFPLAKINLLTGINGRGKSSLLQSLLLMRQSIEHNENTTELILNGNCVHLGTWEDVKNKDEKDEKGIFIGLELEKFTFGNHRLSFKLEFKPQQNKFKGQLREVFLSFSDGKNEYHDCFFYKKHDKLESKKIKTLFMEDFHKEAEIVDIINGKKFINAELATKSFLPTIDTDVEIDHSENFDHKDVNIFDFRYVFFYDLLLRYHYIAADRIGAKDYYPKTLNLGNFVTIDKKGENTVDILLHYKEEQVHENLYREKNEFNGLQNLGQDLETQVGEWIGWILDADVKVIYREIGEFVNQLEFEINGKKFKPSNVGFGYSYILPIITAGLIANEGEILIVENPEAHLHPKAQSRLTEFLAKVAATGVQVFVESHSDHILNALRVCVKQQKIAANDVNVLFFSNDKITQEPKVSFPKIDEDGRIDVWEDDFFDEIDKSLMNLL